jgi:hypothetical protein
MPKQKPANRKQKGTEPLEAELPKTPIWRNIWVLIAIAIGVKFAVIILTTNALGMFLDRYDITEYFTYAYNMVELHQMPYLDFNVEYPQLFIPLILIPMIPAWFAKDVEIYVQSFQVMMAIFDIGTLVCVYYIAKKLYDDKKAFWCGLIYATSFGAMYFVLTKYDAVPVFLMMLAIVLFMYGRELPAYVSSTLGALTKWFPGLLIPYFAIHTYNKKALMVSLGIVAMVIALFTGGRIGGFLYTYIVQVGRTPLASSLPYYLDKLIGTDIVAKSSFILMIIIEIALIVIYWKMNTKDYRILISFIFFSVFTFILLNNVFSPQYALWLTPFIALLLIEDINSELWTQPLIYIYQLLIYLEFPVLYMKIYQNDFYYDGAAPYIFFTLKFITLFAILIVVVYPLRKQIGGIFKHVRVLSPQRTQ